MDKTIKSESDQDPEEVVEDKGGKDVYKGPNMTGVIQPTDMKEPGGDKEDKNNESENNKPEDNKPEDSKPEDNKPEDNKPEDNKPEEKKFQPLKGKRISPAIKQKLKGQKSERGVRKTDIRNDI